MNVFRRQFRILTLLLAIYFWWLGIGSGLYIGASSGQLEYWGGGLRYLTNWVLTLNLLVALNAIFREFISKSPLSIIIPATISMNIVIIVLYWSLRLINQSLLNVNTDSWTLFEWFWDFYLHWGMSLLILVEVLLFKNYNFRKLLSYIYLMIIFFGYIFWIEFFIMPNNNEPCGQFSCGFPYPFLNEMTTKERLIFYLSVWALGTFSFLIARFIFRINKILNEKTP